MSVLTFDSPGSKFRSRCYTVNVLKFKSIRARDDSRLRECDNYAFLAVLAPNFKFPAWLLPQNAEIWRNSSNPGIFGPSVCISVPLFYSIRLISLISADLVF